MNRSGPRTEPCRIFIFTDPQRVQGGGRRILTAGISADISGLLNIHVRLKQHKSVHFLKHHYWFIHLVILIAFATEQQTLPKETHFLCLNLYQCCAGLIRAAHNACRQKRWHEHIKWNLHTPLSTVLLYLFHMSCSNLGFQSLTFISQLSAQWEEAAGPDWQLSCVSSCRRKLNKGPCVE